MRFEEIKLKPKTPFLDVVRAVIMDGGRVLLVQEIDDANWKLPGGKTHENETILEALERELEEELGIKLKEEQISNYLAAPIPESRNIRHIFLINGVDVKEVKTTEEVARAQFFRMDALPETKFKNHISSAVKMISL